MRFQRPRDATSPLFKSSVVQVHRGLFLSIHSFLCSLTQSLNKRLLSTYYVPDTGKRMKGKTDRFPALRKLTRGGEAQTVSKHRNWRLWNIDKCYRKNEIG